MSINKNCGKILAFLREIKLKSTDDFISHYSGLPPSNPESNESFGNVGVEWWYTNKSERICKDLAKMIIASEARFQDCDNFAIK